MSQKIILFCTAGMSTSLLVTKMKQAAAAAGKDYIIEAYSIEEFENKASDAAVCLLGPRVRYALSKLQTEYPDKRIAEIPAQIYGLMDGRSVLALAEKLIGEE